MDFVAIDFETANEKRSSACSIGLAVVRKCKVVEKQHYLIRPPILRFNRFNVAIHGITERDVKDQPTFHELWPKLKPYFENRTLVAHNASFDISVLRHILDEYQIDYPESAYSCTIAIAKKMWPQFINYRLNTVAEYLGLKFKHHNALEDALTCATIGIKACEEVGVSGLTDLTKQLRISNGQLFPGGYRPLRSKRK